MEKLFTNKIKHCKTSIAMHIFKIHSMEYIHTIIGKERCGRKVFRLLDVSNNQDSTVVVIIIMIYLGFNTTK